MYRILIVEDDASMAKRNCCSSLRFKGGGDYLYDYIILFWVSRQ